VWAVVPTVVAFALLFAVRPPLLGLVAAVVVGLGGRVGSAIAAGRLADTRPRWRLVILGWIGLVAAGFLIEPIKNYYRDHHMQAFTIPSGSMMDTLLVGDYIVVDKAVYRARPPGRGDIVVFAHPAPPARTFIFRIVGMPGETLQLRNDQVIVDGRALDEPYARRMPPAAACTYQYGCEPTVIPAGAYFVMGDNRGNANDSRYWGFVRRERILGRAAHVYFSWDSDRHWFRWSRVGHALSE
jgi:signal peptidase I